MGSVVLVAPAGRPDPGLQGLIEAATEALGGSARLSPSPWEAARPGTGVVVVGGTPLAPVGLSLIHI